MTADKERHDILESFTNIYTQIKEGKRSLSISIDDLIFHCPTKMTRRRFENHMAFFKVEEYIDYEIKDGVILSTIELKGILAYTGEYFLEKYEKDKQTEELHNSVLNTNSNSKWTAWLTVIFAFLAAFISYKQYNRNDHTSEKLEKISTDIQSLEKAIQKKEVIFPFNSHDSTSSQKGR